MKTDELVREAVALNNDARKIIKAHIPSEALGYASNEDGYSWPILQEYLSTMDVLDRNLKAALPRIKAEIAVVEAALITADVYPDAKLLKQAVQAIALIEGLTPRHSR